MMHSREKSDAAIVALAIVIRANFAELAQQSYSQLIRWSPLQWVIVALVKPLNVVPIEALVTDLHPGTQRAHGRKFLDGEPDRLGCGRKAAIAQLLSPTLALAHEQFGGYAVVECHSSRSAGFAFMLNPITEIDRKGLFGRHIGLVIPTQRQRLAWHQSLPFAFLNCLAALPIRALVPDRTFVKVTMVSESWSRAHTLRAVIMTYGNSIILFTPSTLSYTAT